MDLKIKGDVKIFSSENLHYFFNTVTGFTGMWGTKPEHNPEYSDVGPLLADIEISTICNGGCKFCYKSNTMDGKNMSLENFKRLFSKFPRCNDMPIINQIAFGADANGTSNPEMMDIFKYTEDQGVIPNVTVADISNDMAERLTSVCGAVAVSRYADKNKCYDSIRRLGDAGLKQVNIHILLSSETLPWVLDTFHDVLAKDSRLESLNAIVLLSLKKKGRGGSYHTVTQCTYDYLIKYAIDNGIRIGFDSCGCAHASKAFQDSKHKPMFDLMSESCESALFSTYIDVEGQFYPCSFAEGVGDWEEGLDVLNCGDFMKDIWYNPKTEKWRRELIATTDGNGCRNCPLFEV
jgi:radical SAM protein with 4Fe4S-binding SPASM domain